MNIEEPRCNDQARTVDPLTRRCVNDALLHPHDSFSCDCHRAYEGLRLALAGDNLAADE
ncbi:hypothetical protein D3C87_1990610 [compost metagenome]